MRKIGLIILSLLLAGIMLSLMGVVSAAQIISWSSLAEHGGVMFNLNVPDDGTFSESRSSGIYLLEIKVNSYVNPDTFSPSNIKIAGLDVNNNKIDLINVKIETAFLSDNIFRIHFSPALPDFGRYKIKINSQNLEGDIDRVLTALKGDAYPDLRVTSTDLSRINVQQGNLIVNSPIEQIRSDINNDNIINSADFNESFKYSGHDARYINEPIISEEVCTDSDGGLDYYVKGSVIMGNGQSYDMCVHRLIETNAQHYASKEGILYDNGCLENNCYVAEAYCNSGVQEFDVVSCPNGCSDGACIPEGNNTPACQSTKCSDGSMTKCALNTGTMVCVCSTCPSKPVQTCTDSDGGQNHYVKGITTGEHLVDGYITHEDVCESNSILFDAYCSGDKNLLEYDRYVCPNGCKDGACIKGEQVTEMIRCIFQNTDKEQKCYLAGQFTDSDLGTKYCVAAAGVDMCDITYTGYMTEKVTWKSSCGQYQSTIQDGNNEKIGFNCGSGETNISSIINKGFKNVYFQCYDGEESKSTDREACKSADYWKKFASNFCAAHCENDPKKCKQKYESQEDIDKCLGKCGINTFSIGDECYLGEGLCRAEESSDACCERWAKENKIITPACVGGWNIENDKCSWSCKAEEQACQVDSDCPIVSCAEGSVCPGYKCTDGKCVSNNIIEPILVCKDSCALDGKCYPFGYRKSGNFCSDVGGFTEQLGGDKICDNNFECSSNVCVSGKCVSEGMIQKIMNWFQRLFGGE